MQSWFKDSLLNLPFFKGNLIMTKANKSPLANMAEALVNPTKASKPETIGFYADGVVMGQKSIDTMNEALKVFHDAKVKLCDTREKSNALWKYSTQVKAMFTDTFLAKGKTKGYIDTMLYPAFVKGVNSGKPITQINLSREKANKNKNKSKGAKTDSALMDSALLKVWELSNVAPQALEYIDSKIDTLGLIGAIEDYLKSQGIDIATE